MAEKIYCPHCKEEIIGATRDVQKCPLCEGKIERFTLDSFAEKNIHLFEIIGIFGALAILLPTIIQGLKDILKHDPTDLQNFSLMVTLLLCSMIIFIFWMGVLAKISDQRKLSPVRKFLSIRGEKNASIRHGDEQFYLFIIFFIPLFFVLMNFLFTLTLNLVFVITIPIAGLGVMSMIFDHLSKNPE
nr:hypothetical protein [uncultured Methanoregula sp.]